MTKYTLITGASSGIGKSLAFVHAKNKRNLILVSRNTQELQSLAIQLQEQYQIDARFKSIDLNTDANCLSLFDYLKSENLYVNEFINNAGIGCYGNFSDIPLESDLKMVNLNITALICLSKFYLNYSQAFENAKLIQIASIASFFPGPRMAVYYASKAFVLSFSKALKAELSTSNCKISVVCPGPTITNFQKTANMHISPMSIKLGIVQTAEEVAEHIFKKVQKDQFLIVPGFFNKLTQVISQIIPDYITNKMVIRSHS
jgi:short-subunit dehydrogenase